ncbi:MAG: hypothetical protein DMF50_13185 [Acidobacteria bacterium]|nr:MAG: hypothetical protein DMF50_13185 [Acidobacteriota bacterium]
MDFLTVVPAAGQGFRHEIGRESLRIGRSSGNDLALDDLNVSRVHAEIVRRPEGHYLLDAGGKNGTYVNERRIAEPALLRPGDRIRLGATTLIFNGAPQSPIEFSDRPLLPGSGATFLPASSTRTPSGGAIPLLLEAAPPPAAAPAGLVTAARTLPGQATPGPAPFQHRPLGEILHTIMDLARRAVPFERGLLMLLEGGRLVPQVVRVPPDEAGRMISISRTITDRVVLNKESVLASDALFDDRFRQGQSVEAQYLRSVMCVPLWNNREVIGLIYVDNRHRAGLFSEENLRVLTHLANVAAIKIENARLFEQVLAKEVMEVELQKAAEIQSHLQPAEGPPIPGYVVYGGSIPCRAVGGDYFDYIEMPGGRFGIGLGDVAGKGLPAALLMCSFQASLRALSELDLRPEETMARLNGLLYNRIPANRFVTFFYGVLDPARHTLTYVNAGQTPPAILRSDGGLERLTQSGRPLGLLPDTAYCSASIALAPGDVLVCSSDGVTEGRGLSDEEFGEERLNGLVREARQDAPPRIVREVLAAIETFHAGEPHQDDITLIILKRT